jgi:hypothetical protein
MGRTNTLGDFSADNLDLHQGYVDIKRFNDSPFATHVGRQEVYLRGQRLVGAVGWTQQGRSFGARFAGKSGSVVYRGESHRPDRNESRGRSISLHAGSPSRIRCGNRRLAHALVRPTVGRRRPERRGYQSLRHHVRDQSQVLRLRRHVPEHPGTHRRAGASGSSRKGILQGKPRSLSRVGPAHLQPG